MTARAVRAPQLSMRNSFVARTWQLAQCAQLHFRHTIYLWLARDSSRGAHTSTFGAQSICGVRAPPLSTRNLFVACAQLHFRCVIYLWRVRDSSRGARTSTSGVQSIYGVRARPLSARNSFVATREVRAAPLSTCNLFVVYA